MVETFAEAALKANPAAAIDEAASNIVFVKGDPHWRLELLTPEARRVHLVRYFDGEIHSEGFLGFFINSLANHCEELLDHLTALGASNARRLLRSAMDCFPGGVVPSNHAEREALDFLYDNDALEDTLEALDQEFYRYEDNLGELLNDYVRAHPEIRVGA